MNVLNSIQCLESSFVAFLHLSSVFLSSAKTKESNVTNGYMLYTNICSDMVSLAPKNKLIVLKFAYRVFKGRYQNSNKLYNKK